MYKFLAIPTILFVCSTSSKCQTQFLNNYSNDIDSLNQILKKNLSKSMCPVDTATITIYHILECTANTSLSTDSFANPDFLDFVAPGYYESHRGFIDDKYVRLLKTESYLVDSNQKTFAMANWHETYCVDNYNASFGDEATKIVKALKECRAGIAFYLYTRRVLMDFIFVVSYKNEMFVIDKSNFSVLTLQEFTENHAQYIKDNY